MKDFLFTITLRGSGETPETAWNDATEGFSIEPGPCPDEYTEEPEDESPDSGL